MMVIMQEGATKEQIAHVSPDHMKQLLNGTPSTEVNGNAATE